MIQIEKAEHYRCCNVCYSQEDVYNIMLRSEQGMGIQVTLCKECLLKLKEKIQEVTDES